MKSPARCAAWLLPLVLSGCIFHKTKPAPLQPLAPSITSSMALDVASLELPPAMIVIPAMPIYNMKEEPVPIKPPNRHRKLTKTGDDTDVAGNATPSAPAIGVLSSGDPENFRHQTEDSIVAIEKGLNGINRQLDDSEQKTAGQIREFLKQAKTALNSGDLDGAHTLAAKAKVLLDELTK